MTTVQWNPDCKGPCDCPGDERVEALAIKADSTNDPILGDEIRGLVTIDESWDITKALEGAWAWGYAAAQRDALDRPYSDRPEAATWKPTPNPYSAELDCKTHRPVQHRDRKRPWCESCGRAADGELIGRPKAQALGG